MSEQSVPFILMLEDDSDRIARFTRVLEGLDCTCRLIYWRTAAAFIDYYASMVGVPRLIALDHDLLVDKPGDPDPGDGREVAVYLATQRPCCPVLIHSTNSIAADSMLFTLRDVGWHVDRISPLGNDWIEAYWYPTARGMIDSDNPVDCGS